MVDHRLPVCRGERCAWTSLISKKRFNCGGGGDSRRTGGEISACSHTTYALSVVAVAEVNCRYPADDACAAQPAVAVAVIVLGGLVVAFYPLSDPGANDFKYGSLPISLV